MTAKNMATEKNQYMKPYIRFWKVVSFGSRRETSFIRHWIVFLIASVSNVILTGAMYARIVNHVTDIGGITKVVDYATMYTDGLYRYFHACIFSEKYEQLVSYIHENFIVESFNDGEKLRMDKFVKTTKRICFTYAAMTTFWTIEFCSSGIIRNVSHNNPKGPMSIIDSDMPFNDTTEHGVIAGNLIHLTSYITISFIFCCSDAFFFSTLMLTASQFELITYSLKSLADPREEEGGGGGEEELEKDVDVEYAVRVVNSCLNHHQLLRRCVSMIEDLYNKIILIDFLHAIISVTFILFDMTLAMNQGNTVRILDLSGYLVLSLVHMWIQDYFGHKVTLKEEEISDAIYEIPWYRYKCRLRKEVITSMILANQARRTTGGKLFNLSLESYGKAIRSIFSYFTVLLQLRDA